MKRIDVMMLSTCVAAVFGMHVSALAQCEIDVLTNPTQQFNFSRSVAQIGEVIVVGAPFSPKGFVFVFRPTVDRWSVQTMFHPSFAETPSASSSFGRAIAAQGDTVVISNGHSDAFVYEHIDGTLQIAQQIHQPGGSFGLSLALDGDLLVVGAPNEDSPACDDGGAVYLYVFDGNQWKEEQVLFGDYCDNLAGFGRRVAVSNGVMMIGDKHHDHPANSTGGVFVFGLVDDQWVLQQTLKPSDYEPGPPAPGHTGLALMSPSTPREPPPSSGPSIIASTAPIRPDRRTLSNSTANSGSKPPSSPPTRRTRLVSSAKLSTSAMTGIRSSSAKRFSGRSALPISSSATPMHQTARSIRIPGKKC